MREDKVTIYTSRTESFNNFFDTIWRYRSLIWVFAKRDLQVKYAQTILGMVWTLVQPLVAAGIYTFFFGYLLGWKADGIAFPLYVLSGLLGWNLFSYIVSNGVNSLLEASHLIKKIYFPKSILPLSKVLIAVVELAFPFLLLLPLLIYYGEVPSWKIVFIPIVLIFNIICALCFVFWFSAFTYFKRDLLHVLPFVLSFGVWFSPVFFSEQILPEQYRIFLEMNPITSIVQMWRWSLFDYGSFEWIWFMNFSWVMILTLVGMYFYNRKESSFSDFL